MSQAVTSALHTFTTALANGETWTLVVVAVVIVVGICGIAGYGVAGATQQAQDNAQLRKSAHSWDRDGALGHENAYRG